MADRRRLTAFFLWLLVASLGVTQTLSELASVTPFTVDVWASNLRGARGLIVDDAGDVLVVTRDAGIHALWEDSTEQVDRALIVNSTDLTHGIALYQNHVYASSYSTVWRWNYTAAQRREASGVEEVVRNVDRNSSGDGVTGGHFTRSLVIDNDGILYVSVGSMSNIDRDDFRARVRSFDLKRSIPTGGYDFVTQGTAFANGLRNSVGLALDDMGRLWAVDNGADELVRDDLGGDIHNDNPAEELNLLDGEEGTFYGYPYCWSEYELATGTGRGSQWVWPGMANGTITDDWCKNTSNVRPPELSLEAHAAALGITFFNGTACGEVVGSPNSTRYAFACELVGDAFVAFHGSWNRDVEVGFKVVRIEFDPTAGLPKSKDDSGIHDIFAYQNTQTECNSNEARLSCIRPVDVKFDKKGALLVTSDTTGQILRVLQTHSSLSSSAPLGSLAFHVSFACRFCISLLVYMALSSPIL